MKSALIAVATLGFSTASSAQDTSWRYFQCDGVRTNVDTINGDKKSVSWDTSEKYRFNQIDVQAFFDGDISTFVDMCKTEKCRIMETYISIAKDSHENHSNGYSDYRLLIEIDRLTGRMRYELKRHSDQDDDPRPNMPIHTEDHQSVFQGTCKSVPSFVTQKF